MPDPGHAQDLLIFAQVIASGGFSAAADKLGLPKSTVSRRIAQLEEHMGEKLLHRSTRRLRLTEFGEALLDHARQIAAEVHAAEDLREHRQQRPNGLLRVSMTPEFALVFLPDMLHAFAERYPAVRLELDLSPRRVDLTGEGYDLAIRMGPLRDEPQLVARPILNMPYGLYAAPGYLRHHGTPTHPTDLPRHATLTLPLRTDGKIRWHFRRGTETCIIDLDDARFTINSPPLLLHLASQGQGITAIPEIFARAHLANGTLVPLLPDWQQPTGHAWAVFPSRRLMPAKTRAFLDMLQTLFA